MNRNSEIINSELHRSDDPFFLLAVAVFQRLKLLQLVTSQCYW